MPTLVLGGARSGKSRYGERLVFAAAGDRPVYLATAEAGDREMTARIAEHRRRRGDRWRTVEEPLMLSETLCRETGPGRAVLVDCLTLWLSNLISAGRPPARESERLCEVIRNAGGTLVMVSNEVGLGLVPETPLGRTFRDAQGSLNQAVAETCDTVVFVAAGQPVALKGQLPE